MKRASGVGVAVIIIAVVALIIATAIIVVSSTIQSRVSLNLGDGVFTATAATTPALRDKGLGDVSTLAPNQALIMAYPGDSKWPISVVGLKPAIDIIWLNDKKQVVYIVTDASPDTSTQTAFAPKSEARYVIEVPAGSVDNLNIKTGSFATFDLTGTEIK